MRVLIFSVVAVVTLVSAAAATSQKEQPGQAPFERVCAACHGDDAKGGQGPSLVPMTMELEELMAKVRNGGGEMPAITKTQMSDDEVKQVLEYLKSL